MGTIWNNEATLCWVASVDDAVSVDELDLQHLVGGTQLRLVTDEEPQQASLSE